MEKTRELPEKSEEMVTISRAEYEALQAKLHAQNQELVKKVAGTLMREGEKGSVRVWIQDCGNTTRNRSS